MSYRIIKKGVGEMNDQNYIHNRKARVRPNL